MLPEKRVSGIAREFLMTAEDFREVQTLAYELTGISLSDKKENMIYGRLARRLRQLKIASVAEYLLVVKRNENDEQHQFINAITTNLTAFFRESHHFDFLKSTLMPSLINKNRHLRKIRIWSAGCSTGEEPYSIAMVIAKFPEIKDWDVKILATDLDSNVLEKGRSGTYAIERGDSIPNAFSSSINRNESEGIVQMEASIRKMVSFKKLNLMHEWPMKGRFDFIFCRNVVIYFDAPTQAKLFDRYANILTSEGHLFIGHSENLHKVCNRFDALGKTVYRVI